jgi:6-phospho-3-hexuloisomerase
MDTKFCSVNREIMAELETCMAAIDGREASEMAARILSARKVFAIGVGRVMLMLQAFVKRLNHLGIEAYYVGEINEPAITADDVLLVASGSGESAVPVAIASVSKKFGPDILFIGSNTQSTIAVMSKATLRIPCRTKLNLPGELTSVQPMSSMFEQSLLLVLDTLAFMILREKGIVLSDLWQMHANLE